MKTELLAFTVACGQAAEKEADACEASFRHWHPDIPFLRFNKDKCRLLGGGNPPSWSGEIVSMRSLAGWFLSRHVKRLVYLDSDIFVLGRLETLLSEASGPTVWTSDYSGYTMRVPECPRINSGVLASSDSAFWETWTAAQYGCMLPALDHFYFNQLCLRLLAQAGAVRGTLVDGRAGIPFYNVSIIEQPGEWRVENGEVYKGKERAFIYHQAGSGLRGIAAAPEAIQSHLKALTRENDSAPRNEIDFEAWWNQDGEDFVSGLKERFPRWPTVTLDAILADDYARTPGRFRTVAPAAWDHFRVIEGTPWRRVWNPAWQAFLYRKR